MKIACLIVALLLIVGCASIKVNPETGQISYTNWKKVRVAYEKKNADGSSESLVIDSNPESAWTGATNIFKAGLEAGKAAAAN